MLISYSVNFLTLFISSYDCAVFLLGWSVITSLQFSEIGIKNAHKTYQLEP